MTDLHVRVRVADEDYALPVTDVLEVADIGDITPVPGAVHAVLGLKNLRGTVITVVDLAAVMDLSATSLANASWSQRKAVGMSLSRWIRSSASNQCRSRRRPLTRGTWWVRRWSTVRSSA